MVFTIRNPDTVEYRIWEKLNTKIAKIMTAFGQVMDEPEDLLQLVLGMTSPSLFRELFSEAPTVPGERLTDWFDQKTARFGGQDVLDTVRGLVGHAARFDFQQVASQIPPLDLPDLKPFFVAMLELNHRRVQEDARGLLFKTPDAWSKEPGVRREYDGLVFDRNRREADAAEKVLGVGHRIFEQALSQAREGAGCVTTLTSQIPARYLLIFRIWDRITSTGGNVKVITVGVEGELDKEGRLLRDWELLRLLNVLSAKRSLRKANPEEGIDKLTQLLSGIADASRKIVSNFEQLAIPSALSEKI